MSAIDDTVHVLHVDDEPDLAELVATYLEREDERLTVRTATSADEGLDTLAAHDIECIVSDYDMPGRNGIAFLEAVREEFPDLPFILYTGKGSEEVASAAISAGVTDYLQKGSGTDQYTVLANRITNAVESYRSRRALAARNRDLRRYEHMINSMEEAACIYDADGRFVVVNEYLADWYDTTREALEGESSNLIPSVRERGDDDPYRALLDGRREQLSGEVEAEFPGHGYAVLEYQLTPLLVDGAVEGVVGVARDITDSTERQEELHRNERAMDEAPVGITISDPSREDNPLIYANDRFRELTGYSEADVRGRNCRLLQGEHTDPEPVAAMREAIDEERRVTVELRNYRKDGTEFWNRVSIAPVRDEDGTVVNYVGFQQDITDRKERERELSRTERRYQAVFDDPNILVGLLDTDGAVLDINRTAMEYVDVTTDELVGTPFWETPWFAHSASVQEEVREWIDRALRGEYVEFEADLLRPDGEPYTIEGVFRPVTNDDGDVVSLLISDRDVTERKQRERELEQYGAYLKESTDIITVLDESGVIEYQSPAVERVLGYEQSELVGQDGFDLVHPDDVPQMREAFADLVSAPDSTVTVECRFRTAADEWRWLEVHGTNQLDHDAIEGIVTNSRDITERVEREQAVQRERDRLDEFAGVVSHDLRTPLNVVEGRLEMAREECDSEHLDAIDTAVDRMGRIIEDVLWLARKGREVGSMDAVAVQDAANAAWELVADEADRAELRFADENLAGATIEADRDRLRQLLENLLGNALEHGGDDVTVAVGALDDGFYVEDDGSGIPASSRDDVFAAGYSTGQEGTGFGLTIVKQVADAHGWDIRVSEGTEGGARFEITGVTFIAE
jgi:PAS domain S-box-containing protein